MQDFDYGKKKKLRKWKRGRKEERRKVARETKSKEERKEYIKLERRVRKGKNEDRE